MGLSLVMGPLLPATGSARSLCADAALPPSHAAALPTAPTMWPTPSAPLPASTPCGSARASPPSPMSPSGAVQDACVGHELACCPPAACMVLASHALQEGVPPHSPQFAPLTVPHSSPPSLSPQDPGHWRRWPGDWPGHLRLQDHARAGREDDQADQLARWVCLCV